MKHSLWAFRKASIMLFNLKTITLYYSAWYMKSTTWYLHNSLINGRTVVSKPSHLVWTSREKALLLAVSELGEQKVGRCPRYWTLPRRNLFLFGKWLSSLCSKIPFMQSTFKARRQTLPHMFPKWANSHHLWIF